MPVGRSSRADVRSDLLRDIIPQEDLPEGGGEMGETDDEDDDTPRTSQAADPFLEADRRETHHDRQEGDEVA